MDCLRSWSFPDKLRIWQEPRNRFRLSCLAKISNVFQISRWTTSNLEGCGEARKKRNDIVRIGVYYEVSMTNVAKDAMLSMRKRSPQAEREF
jgi:hypothetical protein